jgi:hypothetical protein
MYLKRPSNISAILSGLIIGAITHWFQPYNQSEIFGVHIYYCVGVAAFMVGLIIVLSRNVSPIQVALYISLGLVFAILGRIIYDTTFWDSTSHNLAPFEIMGGGGVGLISALIGGYLAVAIKIMRKRMN